jgi:YHS domain-containing protein
VTDPLTAPGLVPHPEGADHRDCPTCDPPAAGRPADHHPGLSTVRVRARGEDFRIVRLQGQLFVCTRQNGNCCCGWEEKGRLAFDPASLWGEEWERRKIRNRLHLTFTGCLGPCAAGNNALLQIHGRSIWLKDLNDPALVPLVFEHAQAMLAAGRVLPAPEGLRDHVYERYLAPPADSAWFLLGDECIESGDGLDHLDPVCLMEVDPSTARHTAEYAGRTIAFCAPSCRKLFLADPAAYLAA